MYIIKATNGYLKLKNPFCIVKTGTFVTDPPFLLICSDVSCFQGLFFCTEGVSLLLYNFCIYHINPPGHEVGICLRSQLAVRFLFVKTINLCS